ncbi:hypothetical protein D3C76_1833180 [compost metagenome]
MAPPLFGRGLCFPVFLLADGEKHRFVSDPDGLVYDPVLHLVQTFRFIAFQVPQ